MKTFTYKRKTYRVAPSFAGEDERYYLGNKEVEGEQLRRVMAARRLHVWQKALRDLKDAEGWRAEAMEEYVHDAWLDWITVSGIDVGPETVILMEEA